MNSTQPEVRILRPEDRALVVEGAGDSYRYLATGAQTNGTYFMLEALVPPGGGPSPHIQTREEEGFYVLEGTLTFFTSEGTVRAGPGTFVHVPRDAIHGFKNQSDKPARVLIWFAPAGIERMFSAMARNPDRYLEIAHEHGVEFPDAT